MKLERWLRLRREGRLAAMPLGMQMAMAPFGDNCPIFDNFGNGDFNQCFNGHFYFYYHGLSGYGEREGCGLGCGYGVTGYGIDFKEGSGDGVEYFSGGADCDGFGSGNGFGHGDGDDKGNGYGDSYGDGNGCDRFDEPFFIQEISHEP